MHATVLKQCAKYAKFQLDFVLHTTQVRFPYFLLGKCP